MRFEPWNYESFPKILLFSWNLNQNIQGYCSCHGIKAGFQQGGINLGENFFLMLSSGLLFSEYIVLWN